MRVYIPCETSIIRLALYRTIDNVRRGPETFGDILKRMLAQLVAREQHEARDAFLCYTLRRFKCKASFNPFPGKAKIESNFYN